MPEIKEAIYEPRRYYEEVLKTAYEEEAGKFFDELVQKSGIDEMKARADAKAYYEAERKRKAADDHVSHYKGWRTFLIVLAVLLALAALFLSFAFASKSVIGYLIGAIVSAILAVADIVYLVAVLRKKIADAEKRHKKLVGLAEEAKRLCYADLVALNASYDWNMPGTILKKIAPILDIDRYFSGSRFRYLVEKFGFPRDFGEDASVLGVVSGNIQGNPFVLEKDLNCDIVDIPYHGQLTISWTETYRDENGTHTQTKTQTLHATTYHPGPRYDTATRLLYGNEAAPNLHFSRSPKGLSAENEKSVERFVKKRTKELQKKAKRDLMDKDASTNFTMMGNNEFDAIFGADNRDNEVEFRLLYTPLAQKNVLDLIRNPHPYGDDFAQHKDGMLNSIASRHSQHFDYSADPMRFVDFDLDRAKKTFVDYCCQYVQGIYFDLAPLLSIPLYQQHMPEEHIYGQDLDDLFSSYEHEAMVNSFDPAYFRPEEANADLPLILKIASSQREGNEDHLTVHAYSYQTTPMLEFVSMMGGDGRIHEVPVHWTKYDYVDCTKDVGILDTGEGKPGFNENFRDSVNEMVSSGQTYFERGLFAYGREEGDGLGERLSSFFQKKKN